MARFEATKEEKKKWEQEIRPFYQYLIAKMEESKIYGFAWAEQASEIINEIDDFIYGEQDG